MMAGDAVNRTTQVRRILLDNPDGVRAADLARAVGVHRTIVYGYLHAVGARSLGRGSRSLWVYQVTDRDLYECETILKMAGDRGQAAAWRVINSGGVYDGPS